MKLFLILLLNLASHTIIGQTIKPVKIVRSDTIKTGYDIPSVQGTDLSEIQITAYRTTGLLRSVAGSVSVIPGDRLENSAPNIATSLAATPGIVMQQGTLGTIKLTLRGIGSRYAYGTKKIKLFFGDIPLYSAEGETTFDDVNPEYISRIEVLRGPASSIHGASLGGTVILYPQRADLNMETVKIMSSAGSYGYFKNGFSYSLGTNKNDLLISLSGIQSNGYRENNGYSRYSFFINQNHIFSKNTSGNLILSGSRISAQIPSSIDSATFANHPQKAAANWLTTKGYEHSDRFFAGYSLRYQIPKAWDFSTSIFLNSRKTTENRPFNYLDETGFAFGGRVLGQHTKKKGNITVHLMAGSNLYFENAGSSLSENIGGKGNKGVVQQDGKETIYQTDFFTQLEIRLNRITITSGVSMNLSGFRFMDKFNVGSMSQSGNYHFAPILAPRLSFAWNPFNDIHLYTSINKGFSIPSLSETLSPLGLINRNIKPEKAWSFESGLRLNMFSRTTFIDLAFYYMRVTDLIVPKRISEDIYVGMNAGSSLHRGFEMALQQWIIGQEDQGSEPHLTIMANLNYSINRFNFQDFTENGMDYSGKKLPGMPDNLLSGSLDLKTPFKLYSKLEMTSSGRIPLNDLNSKYSNGWLIFNIKTGYIFRISKKILLDATMNINNITNEKYASMVVVNAPGTASRPPRYDYPGLPRWFTFTVKLSHENFRK